MRRQRQCFNHLSIPATWIQEVIEGKHPLKRRRRTPVERISLPTPLLLIHLVGNSHLLLSKLPPPTQKSTIAEPLGVEGDKAKIHLRWASTSPQRKKRKTSPKLIVSTMPTNVFTKGNRSQKTSISLGDLYVNNWFKSSSDRAKKVL